MSLKCLVTNSAGEVLVVKESGREWWDLPGDGMDHGDSIKESIARELNEEVGYEGDFSYRIIHTEEPKYLTHGFWQLRLVFRVMPDSLTFKQGEEADDVQFMNPEQFKDSDRPVERAIYTYSLL